jgi:hypothetical protein
MNARPVTRAGSDRPDRRESRLSDTRRRAATPMSRTTAK